MPVAITNPEKFAAIVADALAKSRNFPRWQNAITKAVIQIELGGEFMNYDEAENYLLIWSQGSDKIYSANGVCQCKSFTEYNKPCWHRAAARLVRLYLGLDENKAPVFPAHGAPLQMTPETAIEDAAQMPYFSGGCTKETKREKIGGVFI